MNLFSNKTVRRVHCVGIGGIGVSALAEILLRRGFDVSGSDSLDSERIDYLRLLGVVVHIGHYAESAVGADLVVYTSAVSTENPELQYAAQHGIPTVKRGRLLAELMCFYQGIVVSGTHGKTTTTAMLSHIMLAANRDPTYFIGGIPCAQSSPVHIGEGPFFIAEADESDASFLYMQPQLTAVTNIECDHMSTYAGSEDELRQSFLMFLKHVQPDGCVVLSADDDNLQQISPQITCRTAWYGEAENADYQILDYSQQGLHSVAIIQSPQGKFEIQLPMPGLYNIKNALAALILAVESGMSIDECVTHLATFGGVGRRFESHGNIKIAGHVVSIFEDYGHHPTELRVAYAAAKAAFLDRRVIMVFQPHRYTRTLDLMDEFVDALGQVETLLLLPTYAASEVAIPAASSAALARALEIAEVDCTYIDDEANIMEQLSAMTQSGDVLLFQGAGDVGMMARQLVAKFGVTDVAV